jgi:nucleotide-binding universal stress UspA family protein
MTNRILIPTDFSQLATRALRYACDLAQTCRAELHVLHIVSPATAVPIAAGAESGMGLPGTIPMDSVHDVVVQKTSELQTHMAVFDHGMPVQPIAIVRSGVPWWEIVHYADEVAIDLIVIGSHARSVMKRILLGSTSKSVLEHSACPVLMVPIAALQGDAETVPSESETAPACG